MVVENLSVSDVCQFSNGLSRALEVKRKTYF